ncbi:DUF1465 family protein [Ancylobacter sp. MQZ15Z-1]|uniref:DUF1465 family protein n=1 Tax=Ancylobacter mangrovi TaxID=2972472 RepID=A0A9X2PM15_9HYPH|nr:DUF1465 family protein [Ancylobacter mangrovi]MCS0497582.1 DUF1465 family protein [Ancylobacter mangrovi]
MGHADRNERQPVNLAARRLDSAAFETLFTEGMALVDEAAAYLDGSGRAESRALDRTALNAYAQQSLKLSTRLMQLASWLLLQRAVAEGDMSVETARREAAKIDLLGSPRDEEQETALPESLRALVERSHTLQARIVRLDAGLAAPEAPSDNAVAGHIRRLRSSLESG